VLPTLTLIPAGLDVTRSPLRPVAVTVNVVASTPEVAPRGVNRLVVENGPNTPSAFRARTRHQSNCEGRSLSVTYEIETIGFATNGAASVDVVSTCTS
jgi:hypothetical protein